MHRRGPLSHVIAAGAAALGRGGLAHRLFPGRFPDDLRARVREFHALAYHRTPSDAQIDALLDARSAGGPR